MSAPHDAAYRLDRLESAEQIRNLIARYSQGNDHADTAMFMSIWHNDARWQPDPIDRWFVGLEEIRKRQQRNWDSGATSLHVTTNPLITVEGDTGRGTTDVLVLMRDASGTRHQLTATYSDEYARREGRWGILSRSTVIHTWVQEPTPDMGSS